MKLAVTALTSLVLLVCAPFVVVLLALAGAGGTGQVAAFCATDANLQPILATIRSVESAGEYTAQAARSTASGAYQFLDSTWHGYGGYQRAADAPPEVQDQKAAELVRTILTDNAGDVATVPVTWYLGHLPADGSAEWDTVPHPENGNQLTPRQYQQQWLAEYAKEQTTRPASGGCALTGPSFPGGPMPDHLNCGALSWGGYRNGHIPAEAMRHRPHSGLLHPAASEAFDRLYAAAQQAGLDLRGNGYRPASAGGNTAGTSCHGLGLAVDITALTGNSDTAFASAEFTWLCANAETYGWITPRWAIPAGRHCGSLIGTGAGGNIGDDCCYLEPWHIEAAGIVATHSDFNL
jgi:Transglycosylase-like domain